MTFHSIADHSGVLFCPRTETILSSVCPHEGCFTPNPQGPCDRQTPVKAGGSFGSGPGPRTTWPSLTWWKCERARRSVSPRVGLEKRGSLLLFHKRTENTTGEGIENSPDLRPHPAPPVQLILGPMAPTPFRSVEDPCDCICKPKHSQPVLWRIWGCESRGINV